MEKKRKRARRSGPETAARCVEPRDQSILWTANESQEIVLAIRRGKVDALVRGAEGDQVLILQGADHPTAFWWKRSTTGSPRWTRTEHPVRQQSHGRNSARFPRKFHRHSSAGPRSTPDREMLRDLISRGLSDSTQGEITLNAAEGRPRLVRLALNPVKNSEPRTVCVVATELTELVEANEALRANEESLRQLSARLLKLQDEERRHIARDLHDITGQKLAAQSMALSQRAKPRSPRRWMRNPSASCRSAPPDETGRRRNSDAFVSACTRPCWMSWAVFGREMVRGGL